MPSARVRPPRTLPLLERRQVELETCAFCPKLCRTACPVSNAEPRETLTPWGKMSAAWMSARGDVSARAGARDAVQTAPAWACTECLACTEACTHRNPAERVLVEARSALPHDGSMPEGSEAHPGEVREPRGRRAGRGARARALPRGRRVGRYGAPRRVRVPAQGPGRGPRRAGGGARSSRAARSTSSSAAAACRSGSGRRRGEVRAARPRGSRGACARFGRVLVADPGCALTLRRHYPRDHGKSGRRRGARRAARGGGGATRGATRPHPGRVGRGGPLARPLSARPRTRGLRGSAPRARLARPGRPWPSFATRAAPRCARGPEGWSRAPCPRSRRRWPRLASPSTRPRAEGAS